MAASASSRNGNYDIVSSQPLTEETTTMGTLTAEEPPLPTLPFDLIAEIMCRLPVNLLLQLRCLGRSFNSLISDPNFAKKHLHLSTKYHHLLVSSTNDSHEFLLFDSPISAVFSTSRVEQTQLNHPINVVNDGYRNGLTVCSCDGIMCFTTTNSRDNSFSATLWNPSIRKFKILPSLAISFRKHVVFSFCSFGYDHFIDNYKVILVSHGKRKSNEVIVHTLGTDHWRKIIHDFPFSDLIDAPGVFVSGTVNWLTLDVCQGIVSLDLKKESYQMLSQPDLEKDEWELGVLKDCLCIFAASDMFLNVWIMKEYGNKESWTKLYSVPYMTNWGMCDKSWTKALYISQDDQLLMDFYAMGSNILKLAVFDSKNGTLNIREIQNFCRWMKPNVYIESLISP